MKIYYDPMYQHVPRIGHVFQDIEFLQNFFSVSIWVFVRVIEFPKIAKLTIERGARYFLFWRIFARPVVNFIYAKFQRCFYKCPRDGSLADGAQKFISSGKFWNVG